jgi:hypothetical protein
MVVRTRRAVLRKWLIVVISTVGGVVLVWISWLSIQVGKLCLYKSLNSLVLLTYSLRYLCSLTLTLTRCLLSSESGPQLTYVVLRKSCRGVGDLCSYLSWKVAGTPNQKTNPMSIG